MGHRCTGAALRLAGTAPPVQDGVCARSFGPDDVGGSGRHILYGAAMSSGGLISQLLASRPIGGAGGSEKARGGIRSSAAPSRPIRLSRSLSRSSASRYLDNITIGESHFLDCRTFTRRGGDCGGTFGLDGRAIGLARLSNGARLQLLDGNPKNAIPR